MNPRAQLSLRTLRLVGVLSLLFSPCARAVDIAGVRFPESASVAGQPVSLNGAALRSWATLRIYAIGLYVSERDGTAADILSRPGPKRLTLALLRDTTARELSDALIEGIRDNHSRAEMERLLPRIERLAKVIAAVGFARNGSQITMDFDPARGTRFSLDGEPKGETIEGDDFYSALLRIWLGDNPPQASIKDALLGHAR